MLGVFESKEVQILFHRQDSSQHPIFKPFLVSISFFFILCILGEKLESKILDHQEKYFQEMRPLILKKF